MLLMLTLVKCTRTAHRGNFSISVRMTALKSGINHEL